MPYILLSEAADLLGISKHTLRTYWHRPPRSGRPPLIKSGTRWITDQDKIKMWYARHRGLDGRQHNRAPTLNERIESRDAEIAGLKKALAASNNQQTRQTVMVTQPPSSGEKPQETWTSLDNALSRLNIKGIVALEVNHPEYERDNWIPADHEGPYIENIRFDFRDDDTLLAFDTGEEEDIGWITETLWLDINGSLQAITIQPEDIPEDIDKHFCRTREG